MKIIYIYCTDPNLISYQSMTAKSMQTEEKPPTYEPNPPTQSIPIQSRTNFGTVFVHARDERKANCHAPWDH